MGTLSKKQEEKIKIQFQTSSIEGAYGTIQGETYAVEGWIYRAEDQD